MKHLIAAIILSLAGGPAYAASCGLRDIVIERLKTAFSEQLTVGGLQTTRDAHAVMEIWASRETGTFTVLVTSPNGISCIVAAGTDYFEAAPTIQSEDDDGT